MANIKQELSLNRDLLIVSAISLITVLMWHFIPYGRIILYPFILLGTWFHEMGHGLTALILGGNFLKLELFADGSGVAYWSGDVFGMNFGKAAVAAGGPIAPTIIGALFLILSTNPKRAKLINLLFAFALALSTAIWIRSLFGAILIIVFAIIFFFIAVRSSDRFNKFTLQFIAIQAFMSMYLSIDYLFSSSGTTEVGIYYSDTYHIAENLLLPYWFWAGAICLFSILMIVLSFRILLNTKSKQKAINTALY